MSKLIQGIVEGAIVAVIIIMLAICTDHALAHRKAEVTPTGKDFHCVKLHEVKVKFNIVLGCVPIEN